MDSIFYIWKLIPFVKDNKNEDKKVLNKNIAIENKQKNKGA